jgi:DNA-binding HxlR family transcriptional regulator
MNTTELFAGCPVQHALQYLSGKWQIGILNALKNKPARFVEIKKLLPGISEKVLTQELRYFESKGIIQREVFACIPSKVEYSLTDAGLTLIPVIENIIQWGYYHLQEEKLTREMYSTPLPVIQEIEAVC